MVKLAGIATPSEMCPRILHTMIENFVTTSNILTFSLAAYSEHYKFYLVGERQNVQEEGTP